VSDYNIQIKVRSGRLIRAMRAKGFDTVAALARAMGNANQMTIGDLVNMKMSPINSQGEWRKIALDLAAAVGIPEEDLWPEHLRNLQLRRNVADFDASQEQMATLFAGPSFIDWQSLTKILDRCTARELAVLKMRHGLGTSCGEHTLREIGEAIGAGPERVRQIEAKAIRKMRGQAHRMGLKRIEDVLE